MQETIKTSTGFGPVQIVSITDDHKFDLDEVELKKILFHPRAQDKRVEQEISFAFLCSIQ